MKVLLTFFLFAVSSVIYAQTKTAIDSLKAAIDDEIKFTEPIEIDDTLYALRNTKERKITAFMSADTIKKVVVRFKGSSRIREVYFSLSRDYKHDVIYVNETDSMDGRLLLTIYGWHGKLLPSYSTIISTFNADELKYPELVLDRSDYETKIKFHLIDKIAEKYTFKCKLVEQVAFTPHCGIIAWALVHKFEVLETDYPSYNKKYVLIITSCPEFIGQHFFRKNQIYDIRAATNSGVTFGYSIANKYKRKQLPTFWAREMTPIKN